MGDRDRYWLKPLELPGVPHKPPPNGPAFGHTVGVDTTPTFPTPNHPVPGHSVDVDIRPPPPN